MTYQIPHSFFITYLQLVFENISVLDGFAEHLSMETTHASFVLPLFVDSFEGDYSLTLF